MMFNFRSTDVDESDEEDSYTDDEDLYKDDKKNELNLSAERNVFERVSQYSGNIGLIGIPLSLQTPLDKFKMYTQSEIIKINNYSEKEIFNKNDNQIILDFSIKLNHVEFKNPLAYIFGYFISNGGNEIRKKKIIDTEKILKDLDIDSIKIADVLRYGRLWQNI